MSDAGDRERLETLEDLDDVLGELVALGLVQAWPSRENRFRAVSSTEYDTDDPSEAPADDGAVD